ncbi:phosphopyruvate hydratase [Xenorhabdus japonica]|uniref:Enolase n=1 Tax=Xenorhabdus japonica TaxID=53341 RepID=A0A1I4Z9U2_9GAMM|nr:phosphopyruvate hydratase [Xenorhabdus japonica]SFN46793.1 enolase [Xenorhabdus japonica]
MAKIIDIISREVFDSRADITLEVEVILNTGNRGRVIIPTGSSIGKYEAIEVRDNDKNRFDGKGVKCAIDIINKIIKPKICGLSPFEQESIDNILIELDGTNNKSHLGANSILGVSLAVAQSAAIEKNVYLYEYLKKDDDLFIPQPIFSMLSGGRHGDGNCDFQDFQIIVSNKTNLKDSMQIGKNIYLKLRDILLKSNMCIGVSGTGSFMPSLKSNEDGLLLLMEAIYNAGYEVGKEVNLSMDIAAEMFFKNGKYHLATDGNILSTDDFVTYLKDICNKFPISLIEDPLAEDDFKGWIALSQAVGKRIELVGDDLFTTNIERFKDGLSKGIANSILIKPNQIGTVTETINLVSYAKQVGYKTILSRRSGETEDTSIADLAVALKTDKVKFGSFARTESLAKYNRLLRIEEKL